MAYIHPRTYLGYGASDPFKHEHAGRQQVAVLVMRFSFCAGSLLADTVAGTDAEGGAAAVPSDELEVDVSVKDGGMMLVTALTPELRWQSGAAELALSVRGAKSQPQVRPPERLLLRSSCPLPQTPRIEVE